MNFKILTGGLLMITCMAQAQSGVSTQGGTFKTAKASLQWTVGESAVTTLRGSKAMLTQGFNQPPLVAATTPVPPGTPVPPTPTAPIVVTGASITAERIKLEVFPNPVTEQLTVSMSEPPIKGVLYRLIAPDGKMVLSGAFKTAHANLDFSNYTTGTYILLLNQVNQPLKSFKIIKK